MRYISLPLGILSWLWITLTHVNNQLIAEVFPDRELTGNRHSLLLLAFYLFNAVYFDFRIHRQSEKFDALQILRRLVWLGAGGLSAIIFFNFLTNWLNTHSFVLIGNAVGYSLSMYVFCVFLNYTTFTFRRFILYEPNRTKIRTWNLMRMVLLATLVFSTNIFGFHEYLGNIYNYFGSLLLLSFVVYMLYVTADLSWTNHLSYRQKIKVIGFFLILFFVILAYLILLQFLPSLFDFYNQEHEYYDLYYISGLFGLFYCLATLVILGSYLRTSALLEAQSQVIESFKRINQAITANLDETDVLDALMNGATMLSGADAAWIEFFAPKTFKRFEVVRTQDISLNEIQEILPNHGLIDQVLINRAPYVVKKINPKNTLNQQPYQSLLCVPIFSNQENYGALLLVKKYENAFEEYTMNAVMNLSEQTGAALEHKSIVSQALATERYQAQIRIAQSVQHSLLPQELPRVKGLDMGVVNKNAEEIGGDFYDIYLRNNHTVRVAIGDISGHGLNAAFYMAVVKGIFHTLAQSDNGLRQAVIEANTAIKKCFASGVFFTLTYNEIDFENQTLSFLRAGHCPVFYYHAHSQKVELYLGESLGLGIVGNSLFCQQTPEPLQITFQSNDILLLLTDGILEAKDPHRNEFQTQKVQALLYQYRHAAAQTIANLLLEEVQKFTQTEVCEDDMTAWVIKFV